MKYIIHFLITALLISMIVKYELISGISLEGGYLGALLFSVVLGVMNLIIGSILRIVTLPIRFLTLGLFSFVIWVFIVFITDRLLPDITITGIIPLILFAALMSVSSFFLKLFR